MNEAMLAGFGWSALFGGLGGLALVCSRLMTRRYRSRVWNKVTLETGGAVIVATGLSSALWAYPEQARRLLGTSFVLGVCWSGVVSTLRDKVTFVVGSVLRQVELQVESDGQGLAKSFVPKDSDEGVSVRASTLSPSAGAYSGVAANEGSEVDASQDT